METQALVKTDNGTIEVIHGVSPSRERRDKAISAVCGELLSTLEQRKPLLKEKLEAVRKAIAALDDRIKRASESFQKDAKRFFKADIAGITALARKYRWGTLILEAEIDLSKPDEVCATLNVKNKEESTYRDGLVVKRKVKLSSAILKLHEERLDLNKRLYDVQVELATLENHVARLPQTKLLVEAAVAKNDLQQDDAGRRLYDAVRASFTKMVSPELRTLLEA